MTKTGAGAKILDIGQFQACAVDFFGLFQIRTMGGSLFSFKLHFVVGAVAKRHISGVTTTAERISFLYRILLRFLPAVTLPIFINAHRLLRQRHPAGDHIRTVFRYFDFIFGCLF